MTRFNETKAADHQFTGKYQVAGWCKPRDLIGKTFHIHGIDFRDRESPFSGDMEKEYVIFFMFDSAEDCLELNFDDPTAMYGTSGTHYRIMAQLEDIGPDDVPVEYVTVHMNNSGKGNPALELCDPFGENAIDTATAAAKGQHTTGGNGRGTTSGTGNGSARDPQSGNVNKPSTSTQRPTANRTSSTPTGEVPF